MTTFYRTSNNVSTTTTGCTSGSGSIALASGVGASFGSPSPSAPIVVSTFLADGEPKGIYSCTGRTGDTLTGLTLLSGTDASIPSGGLVEMRWTAEHAGQITGALSQAEQDLEDLAADVAALGNPAADLAAHLAAEDPHPQYLTAVEGGAAYSATGHTHTASGVTDFSTAADARIAAQKAAANGLATLDADAKVPTSQLPALAISETFVVGSQAAMLDLIAQPGDVAVRTDLSKSFILTADPATVLANWQELLTPAGNVGTVTSVAMTVPGVIFSSPVTGSPITSSGTLALALATQAANVVLAGPTSGGAAMPTFRALVAADLPAGVALLSSANVFTADQAVVGKVIARASGGTPGTDEVQIYTDGTRSYIQYKKASGGLRILKGNGGVLLSFEALGGDIVDTAATWLFTGTLRADGGVSLGNAGDCRVRRAGAKVVDFNDGGSAGATLRSVPLTPAQITADANNYAPAVAWIYRLSTDASRNVTGLSISQFDGQMVRICNVGSNNLVLKHQDTNSTAANRFICNGSADITLAADEEAAGWYDGTAGILRWRIRKV